MPERPRPVPESIILADPQGREVGLLENISNLDVAKVLPLDNIYSPEPVPFADFTIQGVAGTHHGMQRADNQDAYYFTQVPSRIGGRVIVGLVTDGVGSEFRGDIASNIVARGWYQNPRGEIKKGLRFTRALLPLLENPDDLNFNMEAIITRAIQDTNNGLIAINHRFKKPSLTTLSGFLLLPNISGEKTTMAYIFNIGDSRTYIDRRGHFVMITKDHAKGNQLTRSLGENPLVTPDIFPVEVGVGDILYLCTDGVSKVLSKQSIQIDCVERYIRNGRPYTEPMVLTTLTYCLLAGAPDNATVMAVSINSITRSFR